jgi:hypothetical protein
MAEQFWLVKTTRMRQLFFVLVLSTLTAAVAHAQDPIDTPPQGAANAPMDPVQKATDAKVRGLLDSMVKALGGDKWLNLPGFMITGRTSSFYKGKPTGGTADFALYHAYPDKDRTEYGKKHDVVDILVGNEGWEITYKGKIQIPQKDVEDAVRRRNHSIEIAIRQWLKDPDTLLIDGGQRTVERHLVDRVTLLSSTNDNITLELDAQTHLPVRRTYEWRDPLYKDKNVDADEYDNYHEVNGIQTPFTVTRFHNDDMSNQRFLYNAVYAGPIPATMFDPDAAVAKIVKK